MSILRLIAIVTAAGAAPLLAVSAEDLAARSRAHLAAAEGVRPVADGRRVHLAAARAQDVPMGADVAPRANRMISAPFFTRVVIETSGVARFEGTAAPNADITLSAREAVIGRTTSDANGRWQIAVEPPLPPGDHRIASSASIAASLSPAIGQELWLAIPDVRRDRAVVAYEAPAAGTASGHGVAGGSGDRVVDPLRRQAEDLAAAATERFTEIVPPAQPPAIARPRIAQAPGASKGTPDPASSGKPIAPAAQKGPSTTEAGDRGLAAPVVDWLEHASRTYQGTIVKGLATPEATSDAITAVRPPSPAAKSEPSTAGPPVTSGLYPESSGDALTDVGRAVEDWLMRANRDYQTEVIRKLATGQTVPAAPAPPAVKAADPAREQREKAEARAKLDAEQRRIAEDKRLADAKLAEAAKSAATRSPPPKAEETRPEPAKPEPVKPDATKPDAARLAPQKVEPLKPAETAKSETPKSETPRQDTQRVDADAARKTADERRATEAEARAKADEAARLAKEASARAAAKAQPAADASKSGEPGKPAEAALNAADIARKAVEAARAGPQRREAGQVVAERAEMEAKSGTKPPRPGPSGGRPEPEKPPAVRPSRPKDTRVEEGSGERGPVDKPGGGAGRTAAAGSTDGAASCARAGRQIRPPGTYVVGNGDTLSEIAERHYGSSRRLVRILRANRKIRDPDLIRVCQRIRLP